MLNTKEHYDLLDAFERNHRDLRLDRENRALWAKGRIYQSGETNSLFLAFRNGYALGKVICDEDAKAAAQADYERRILAALEPAEPAPAAEPVAWRYETTSEHIARDIRAGRFPARSERQQVPVTHPTPAEPAPAARSGAVKVKALETDEVLWCETCGERPQEVHTEHAGLCRECWVSEGRPE